MVSIGVPTVIDSKTLILEAMGDEQAEEYFRNRDMDMIVTSTDIDQIIKDFSDIIANGINIALHPRHIFLREYIGGKAMKKRQAAVLAVIVFVITAVLLVNVSWEKKDKEAKLTESQLGIMCMSSVFSTMEATGDKDAAIEKTSVTSDKTDKKSDGEDIKKKSKKDRKKMLKNGDPLVIIYHTHASESYQPSSEGNFHREGEKDTVREVGDIMEDVMEDAGINVTHDKTMHDRPSYNESYARSLETIQRLNEKIPYGQIRDRPAQRCRLPMRETKAPQ